MSPFDQKPEDGARLIGFSTGWRGDLVKALNAFGERDASSVVTHVYPGNPSLPHDLLRSLGKRSDSPGWPKDSRDAWGLVQPWFTSAEITDLFIFPADDLTRDETIQLQTIAGVRRVWLISNRTDPTCGIEPASLGDWIHSQRNDGTNNREPAERPKFEWSESIVLARSKALFSMDSKMFRAFDAIWLSAKAQTHHMLALPRQTEQSRWVPLLCSDWDGSACAAATAGVVAAYTDEGKELPTSITDGVDLLHRPFPLGNTTSSTEALAAATFDSLGLGPYEAQSLRVGQLRTSGGLVTLLGVELPADVSRALIPQITRRYLAGAQPGDRLFGRRPAMWDSLALDGVSWYLREANETKIEKPFGRILFQDERFSIRGLHGAHALPLVRKLISGSHKHGVPFLDVVSKGRPFKHLEEIGAIEKHGDFLRGSEKLMFSLERGVQRNRLHVQAQLTRNSGAIEEHTPLSSRLEHFLAG